LRYLYVLARGLLPEGSPEAPRSRIGRYVFGATVLSFAASFWPVVHHELLALLATGLVVWSFSRSFAYSWRASQKRVA
jgi:hypothetical protein